MQHRTLEGYLTRKVNAAIITSMKRVQLDLHARLPCGGAIGRAVAKPGARAYSGGACDWLGAAGC
jgi:hypothetical protein